MHGRLDLALQRRRGALRWRRHRGRQGTRSQRQALPAPFTVCAMRFERHEIGVRQDPVEKGDDGVLVGTVVEAILQWGADHLGLAHTLRRDSSPGLAVGSGPQPLGDRHILASDEVARSPRSGPGSVRRSSSSRGPGRPVLEPQRKTVIAHAMGTPGPERASAAWPSRQSDHPGRPSWRQGSRHETHTTTASEAKPDGHRGPSGRAGRRLRGWAAPRCDSQQ